MRRGVLAVGTVMALVLAACGGGAQEEPAVTAASGGAASGGVQSSGSGSGDEGETQTPPTAADKPASGRVDGPAVWVVGNEGGTILRYDGSLELASQTEGSLDGVDLFLTGYATAAAGRLWLSYSDDSEQLLGVDPDAMKVVSETDLPEYPYALFPGAGRVWVTYGAEGMLTEVMPDGTAVPVSVEGSPHTVIDHGDSGWLFDGGQNRLFALRPDDGSAELAIGDLSTGDPLAVAEVGSELWVAVDDGLDVLMRIDTASGEASQIWCAADTGDCQTFPDDIMATAGLEGGIEFGDNLLAVGGEIWATSSTLFAFVGDPMTLYVIDPDSLTVTRTAELPLATDMVATPDGVYLVSNEELGETGCGRVYRVDPGSLEVTTQTDLPPDVCADYMFYG